MVLPLSSHELPTLLSSVIDRSKEPSEPNKEEELEKAQKSERIEVSCHASEGSKWHLELLAVSAELKQKLQDPQFVATRCDLDGSGDLDLHELKQAARVYGIFDTTWSNCGEQDSCPYLQPMSRTQRISKENFAGIMASHLGSIKLIRASFFNNG